MLENSEVRKFVIMFVDGRENSSFIHKGKYAITANEVAENARKNNIKLIIIGYGDEVNENILNPISMLLS